MPKHALSELLAGLDGLRRRLSSEAGDLVVNADKMIALGEAVRLHALELASALERFGELVKATDLEETRRMLVKDF